MCLEVVGPRVPNSGNERGDHKTRFLVGRGLMIGVC